MELFIVARARARAGLSLSQLRIASAIPDRYISISFAGVEWFEISGEVKSRTSAGIFQDGNFARARSLRDAAIALLKQ